MGTSESIFQSKSIINVTIAINHVFNMSIENN
jgi:hypothetical protein